MKLNQRRCPRATRARQGEVLHHPHTTAGVGKGCRKTIPDGWVWEVRGDGAGWQDRGGLFGADSAFWLVAPLHPHAGDGPSASSEVAIYFYIFLFYFTRPV